MRTATEDTWWPLALSEGEEDLFSREKACLDGVAGVLDQSIVQNVIDLAGATLENFVEEAVISDRLPIICHMLLGLGNLSTSEGNLVESISTFIGVNDAGKLGIAQCHPEGDIHPWQTICYALLSGLPASKVVDKRRHITFEALAEASTDIGVPDTTELGHLLLTWTFLSWPSNKTILINGEQKNLSDILVDVIDAHKNGPFYVCRKFHLTEAVCAAVSAYKLNDLQSVARSFLAGQLDMGILLLCCSPEDQHVWTDIALKLDIDANVRAVRTSLAIWDQVENFFYLAGHVIELGALAWAYGYPISQRHKNMINKIINRGYWILGKVAQQLTMEHAHLGLSHFRRGVILWNSQNAGSESVAALLRQSRLHKYVRPQSLERRGTTHCSYIQLVGGQYLIAPSTTKVSGLLSRVAERLARSMPDDLKIAGAYPHFRRVRRDHWPRTLHYEILEDQQAVSFEFHLEEIDANLELILQKIAGTSLAYSYSGKWRWGFARLVCKFDTVEEAEIVKRGSTFINDTIGSIEEGIQLFLAKRLIRGSRD